MKSMRQVVDTAVRQRLLSENCNLTPQLITMFSMRTDLFIYVCFINVNIYTCVCTHMYVPACRGQHQALPSSTLFFEQGPSLIQLGCLLRNELQELFSVITLQVLTALCGVLHEDWRPESHPHACKTDMSPPSGLPILLLETCQIAFLKYTSAHRMKLTVFVSKGGSLLIREVFL